jgi:sugar phosphate isomerase/epimerase
MSPADAPFKISLNTSTISGQKHSLIENIRIAAQAGYDGVEPWVRELDDHVKQGGRLQDVARAARDAGLSIENVIGFFEWAVDDPTRRAKGIEEAKRNLDQCAKIGAKRLAAPPWGAHAEGTLDLHAAADRYRQLLEVAEPYGVVPMLEFWGASKNLSRLGEALLVAAGAGHPRACLLADVYHLYKGGSPEAGLRLVRGQAIGLFHLNDYPATPPRDAIADADRVYPGDGVAPLGAIFRTLRDIGYRGHLSVELFNKSYWAEDAMKVAKTGLEKARNAIAKAMG